MPPPDVDPAHAVAMTPLGRLTSLAKKRGAAPASFLADLVLAMIDGRSMSVDAAGLRLVHAFGADGVDPAIAAEVASWPASLGGVDLLGQLHESLLAIDHRHAHGVYYTPVDVAEHVVHLVDDSLVAAHRAGPPVVCDPAMGGGAFLLAAARALESRGWARQMIVEELLWGLDIDPVAVAVTQAALVLWAAEAGEVVSRTNLIAGDTLLAGRELLEQHDAPVAGFDAVVGNPPFQSQLGRSTARRLDATTKLQDRFGKKIAWRYTDTAALFLLESCRWVRPAGRVALVLPQSVLVSDDAKALRDAVLDLGGIDHVWLAGEPVFAASVRVCVPVVRARAEPRAPETVRAGMPGTPVPDASVDSPRPDVVVTRSRGRSFSALDPMTVSMRALSDASTWGGLVRDLFGAPLVELQDGDTLASFCRATAGFRDQYYGLVPFVREASVDEVGRALERLSEREVSGESVGRERPARGSGLTGLALLMTCGLIDPARCRWGVHPTKFARSRWEAPVVDLDALAAVDRDLATWTAGRLVPKLVVSTQTRVLEAAVDVHGDWYPSVPTIAVSVAGDRLWHAAAVVMAPAISAWAMGRHGGAALSSDAIKISARQLLDAPVPGDEHSWDDAIDPLRAASVATDGASWRAAMEHFGGLMHRAYGGDDEVLVWWLDRLPPWR